MIEDLSAYGSDDYTCKSIEELQTDTIKKINEIIKYLNDRKNKCNKHNFEYVGCGPGGFVKKYICKCCGKIKMVKLV